ncbi:hypothetical protein LTS18_010388 [Coniosporium uncinatum]|uniref:Uncharacterized protein n=1 Tax=Coniosporium uncinatum TaxID=93489 RepID=A0ACC3DX12_9PEZI|nr:hypothetical protein LTS18_010388 [Coniosporium uncinatum]
MSTVRAVLKKAGPLDSIVNRSFAANAVHVKIFPRPANIAESRELLRVLQTFGEVVHFRWLKHETQWAVAENTYSAIYASPTSADSLLKASPLRYSLEPIADSPFSSSSSSSSSTTANNEDALSEDADIEDELLPSSSSSSSSSVDDDLSALRPPNETKAASTTPNPTSPTTSSESEPESEEEAQKRIRPPKEFALDVDRQQMSHVDIIERRPWYHGYEIDASAASIPQQDLLGSVPLVGLSDIKVARDDRSVVRRQFRGMVAGRRGIRAMMAEVKGSGGGGGVGKSAMEGTVLGRRGWGIGKVTANKGMVEKTVDDGAEREDAFGMDALGLEEQNAEKLQRERRGGEARDGSEATSEGQSALRNTARWGGFAKNV